MVDTWNIQTSKSKRFLKNFGVVLNNYLSKYEPSLREKCSYSELFWSVFSRIRTKYGEIQNISSYLVRMRENTDQNNSEYEHFFTQCILSFLEILIFNNF